VSTFLAGKHFFSRVLAPFRYVCGGVGTTYRPTRKYNSACLWCVFRMSNPFSRHKKKKGVPTDRGMYKHDVSFMSFCVCCDACDVFYDVMMCFVMCFMV